ncbi:hypothetical protein HELRODRAFT_178120 [Helobdella robusta]|uniref:Uncharacterized protein n=1 Tax=Helobdella robusta TaxID=6412 RepID=T1FCS0_HELRO|nr:hypothetical protein HELRODRAFT_178120 [Helobdella robusta]ESN97333.1 hypothetical protein HELRODRAFT_178120 [Helobdella robusta]
MDHLVAVLVLISVVPLEAKLIYRRPSPCSENCPSREYGCYPCKCDEHTDLTCRKGEFCTLEKSRRGYFYWSCYTGTRNEQINMFAGYIEDKPCEHDCNNDSCSNCRCKFTDKLTCETGEHCGGEYSDLYGHYIACYYKNQYGNWVSTGSWDYYTYGKYDL